MVDVMQRRVVAGHCEVHCLEAGPPGGQDIVLLHGMKFKARTWQELGTLEVLAGAGKHALALDLPGFGASPACAAAPGEVLADFLTQMRLTKPVLIGPSMGGRVALEFCLDHADLVGALVLVGAVGVQENRGAPLGRHRADPDCLGRGRCGISPGQRPAASREDRRFILFCY